MDRDKLFRNTPLRGKFDDINDLHRALREGFKKEFNRTLPFSDELFDRWEKARYLGFGKGTSIYDNAYVFGNVQVGKDTWIGPYTIIDGSGGLVIGNNCTISSGVHIYTHSNLKKTLLAGNHEIEREPVSIGNNTYIGPNAVISMGVVIGSQCVLATNSFLKGNMEDNAVYAGNPAKKIGEVIIQNGKLEFRYQ